MKLTEAIGLGALGLGLWWAWKHRDELKAELKARLSGETLTTLPNGDVGATYTERSAHGSHQVTVDLSLGQPPPAPIAGTGTKVAPTGGLPPPIPIRPPAPTPAQVTLGLAGHLQNFIPLTGIIGAPSIAPISSTSVHLPLGGGKRVLQ
jgi:hypothetical protein